jgi:hypothetical protein
MEKTIKSSAINLGLYLGGLLALSSILAYALYLDLFTKWWYGIGMMLLIIVIGVYSAVKSKKTLNGFISFKDAFASYFIPIAIALIISTIIGIAIFNFIDPEAAVILKEKIVDSTVEMLRNFNAPEEAVAQTVEQLESEENMFSIGNQVWGLAKQLIGFSDVGLIDAIIIKRNPESE